MFSGAIEAGVEQEIVIFFRGGGDQETLIYFPRGDVDGSGSVNISDALQLSDYLFAGGSEPETCEDVWDVDGSGSANITDVNLLLNHLFAGGPAPPSDVVACYY